MAPLLLCREWREAPTAVNASIPGGRDESLRVGGPADLIGAMSPGHVTLPVHPAAVKSWSPPAWYRRSTRPARLSARRAAAPRARTLPARDARDGTPPGPRSATRIDKRAPAPAAPRAEDAAVPQPTGTWPLERTSTSVTSGTRSSALSSAQRPAVAATRCSTALSSNLTLPATVGAYGSSRRASPAFA